MEEEEREEESRWKIVLFVFAVLFLLPILWAFDSYQTKRRRRLRGTCRPRDASSSSWRDSTR